MILTQGVLTDTFKALEDALDNASEFGDEHYGFHDDATSKWNWHPFSDSGIGSRLLSSAPPSSFRGFKRQSSAPSVLGKEVMAAEAVISSRPSGISDSKAPSKSSADSQRRPHKRQPAMSYVEKPGDSQKATSKALTSHGHASRHTLPRMHIGRFDTTSETRTRSPQTWTDPRDLPASSMVQLSDRHAPVAPTTLSNLTGGSPQTCLPYLAQLFTQIDLLAFSQCETFIQNRPSILKQDGRLFLCQAALAYRADEKHYAKVWVHRYLIISKCSDMDDEELEE
jgi:hypothetical protein